MSQGQGQNQATDPTTGLVGVDVNDFNKFVSDYLSKHKSARITKSLVDDLLVQFKQKKVKEQKTTQTEETLSKTELNSYINEVVQSDTAASQLPAAQQAIMPTRQVLANAQNMGYGATGAMSTARLTEGGSQLLDYSGQKLVDKNGNIVRDPYSSSDVEFVFRDLSAQSNAKLKDFLNVLHTHGYYGSSKPSSLALAGNGYTDADNTAIGRFLEQANRKGLTYDAYLPMVAGSASTYDGSGGGSGGTFSSKEDISTYLMSAGFKYLGRPMTKEEIDAAVKRIQAEQLSRTSSSGGEQPTTLSTSAMLEAQKISPEEYASYSLGAALDRITATIGAGK